MRTYLLYANVRNMYWFQLLGKWFHISESTNIIGSQLLTKMFMDNAWGNFTASSKEDGMNVDFSYKM